MTIVHDARASIPGGQLRDPAIPGAITFVRYAFPPNYHGSCGPPDHRALFEYGVSAVVDGGLRALAGQFAGAYPYLELIARTAGIPDPLDRRVVEAYWIGNRLLERVGVRNLADSMDDRFRRRVGGQFSGVTDAVLAGGVPHHSYHVLCVYPFVGLLGDDRRYEQALTVLQRCRIRWGTVVAVQPHQLTVSSRPLCYEGGRLLLGPERLETVERTLDGVGLVQDFAVGDQVSMHWEWVCDRLTAAQVAALRHYTALHLQVVNERTGLSGVRRALG